MGRLTELKKRRNKNGGGEEHICDPACVMRHFEAKMKIEILRFSSCKAYSKD